MHMLTSDYPCVCACVYVKPSVCVWLTWHRQRCSTVLGGFVGTAVNIINITVLNIIFVNIVITRASVTVSFIAFFTYGIAVTRTSIYASRFPGITTSHLHRRQRRTPLATL